MNEDAVTEEAAPEPVPAPWVGEDGLVYYPDIEPDPAPLPLLIQEVEGGFALLSAPDVAVVNASVIDDAATDTFVTVDGTTVTFWTEPSAAYMISERHDDGTVTLTKAV